MKPLLDALGPAFWSMGLVAAGVYGLHLYRQEGYDAGYALAAAQGTAELATLRESHANELLAAARQATAQMLIEQQRSDQLTSQLADAQRLQRQTTDRLTGEINRVTTLYRRALNKPPQLLPAAVFTTGFVRVWNDANGVGTTQLPAAAATSGAAAPSDTTGAADQLDSGISQGALLTNHIRNAESYAACRTQLNGLIDWALNADQ